MAAGMAAPPPVVKDVAGVNGWARTGTAISRPVWATGQGSGPNLPFPRRKRDLCESRGTINVVVVLGQTPLCAQPRSVPGPRDAAATNEAPRRNQTRRRPVTFPPKSLIPAAFAATWPIGTIRSDWNSMRLTSLADYAVVMMAAAARHP